MECAPPWVLFHIAFALQLVDCGAERPQAQDGRVEMHGVAWRRATAPSWARPGRWVHDETRGEGMILTGDIWQHDPRFTIMWQGTDVPVELTSREDWAGITEVPLHDQYAPFEHGLQESIHHYTQDFNNHMAAGSHAHKANSDAANASFEYMDDLESMAQHAGLAYKRMHAAHQMLGIDGVKWSLKRAKNAARMRHSDRSTSRFSVHKDQQAQWIAEDEQEKAEENRLKRQREEDYIKERNKMAARAREGRRTPTT